MPAQQYLIIGDGVFGISTAIHALDLSHSSETSSQEDISILTRRQFGAASDDISKIIRVDYPSAIRMQEAIHAQEAWTANERYSPYYRPFGRIVSYEEGASSGLDDINVARASLGLETRKLVSKDILREHYGTTEIPDGQVYSFNSDDGMVEWKDCLASLRKEAEDLCSVRFAAVKRFVHQDGKITAVEVENDIIYVQDKVVILAGGSWIGGLLQASSIEQPLSSRAPVAVGIFAFVLRLDAEQSEFFYGKPVFSHQGRAEFMPPATEGSNECKITWVESFTNKDESTSALSLPEDLSKSSLAIQAMLKLKQWVHGYMPKLSGAKIVTIKSYWDGFTETQDPLIAKHPEFENLIIAGGGSFNRAKDLPTIGSTILQACKDEQSVEYKWEARDESANNQHPSLLPVGNFRELEDAAAKNPEVQSWIAQKRSNSTDEYIEIL